MIAPSLQQYIFCHRYMCMQTSHADAPARSAQVSPPAPETHSLPAPPSLHLPPPPIRHTVPAAIPPDPMTKPPPPVHSNQPRRHESSNMPACGPTQQRQSNRKSQWDVPPNPVENTWNSQPHGQQPEQHAARQSVHSRDASPEQLAQRLKGFSLQPADLAGEPSSYLLPGNAKKLAQSLTAMAHVTAVLCRNQYWQAAGKHSARLCASKPACTSNCCSHTSGHSCLPMVKHHLLFNHDHIAIASFLTCDIAIASFLTCECSTCVWDSSLQEFWDARHYLHLHPTDWVTWHTPQVPFSDFRHIQYSCRSAACTCS